LNTSGSPGVIGLPGAVGARGRPGRRLNKNTGAGDPDDEDADTECEGPVGKYYTVPHKKT